MRAGAILEHNVAGSSFWESVSWCSRIHTVFWPKNSMIHEQRDDRLSRPALRLFKFTTSGKVGEEGVERVEDGGPCAPPQAPRHQPTSLTLPAPSIMTHDRAALPGRCDVLGREKGAFVN